MVGDTYRLEGLPTSDLERLGLTPHTDALLHFTLGYRLTL